MLYHVTAVIKPHKLDDVVEALNDVGLHEFTMTEVGGFSGRAELIYRGTAYPALTPRVLVDVVVAAPLATMVGELIASNARTSSVGDGTVWLTPIEQAIDVHTGNYDVEPG